MLDRKNIAVIAMLLVAGAVAGCGGSAVPDSSDSPDSSTSNTTNITPWHEVFNSPNYAGSIALKFKLDQAVRLDGKKLSSKSMGSALGVALKTIETNGATVRHLIDLPEETVDKAIARGRAEGLKINDWNSYYVIDAPDPKNAEELYKDLVDSGLVEWAEPVLVVAGSSVNDTPDVSNEEAFVGSHVNSGGLNIQAAWDVGISGQGVTIIDDEPNWNLSHEDLPLSLDSFLRDSDGVVWYDPNYNLNLSVQHGTSVVGLLAGIDNGHGVKGISNSSTIKLVQSTTVGTSGGRLIKGLLESYANGDDLGTVVKKGDILLLVVGNLGVNNDCPLFNGQPSTYCFPIEAFKTNFETIRELTETWGITVVEGAGNSGVDLDNPNGRLPGCLVPNPDCPDLSLTEDVQLPPGQTPAINQLVSGAVMVGASGVGHANQNDTRPNWSNCGRRMDVYGWGRGVVTTGYGDHRISVQGDQNKWYTADFNGTSSAGTLVAGSVALIQSYTIEKYKNLLPHKKVYFDGWQMRQILKETGVNAAANEACKIGVKPDVGAAIAAIDRGDYLPKVAPDTPSLVQKAQAVSGIRYDMDRDGRADLISWTNGEWKVDLSTVAPNIENPDPDNYGAWDIMIQASSLNYDDGIYYPLVNDYDSDGDADLTVYDSKHGLLYIKYTTTGLLQLPQNSTFDWDEIIDYSNNEGWQAFSRPEVGDFNGDGWLDMSIIANDGYWYIDYGGIGRLEKQGNNIMYVLAFEGFEENYKIFTDAQMAAAPVWAYGVSFAHNGTYSRIWERVPDGVNYRDRDTYGEVNVTGGNLYTLYYPRMNRTYILGGDDYGVDGAVMANGDFSIVGGNSINRSLFLFNYPDVNDWSIVYDGEGFEIEKPDWPYSPLCFPVPADYDGDSADEVALKCQNVWMIADHDVESYRVIQTRVVGLDDSFLSLPPTVYDGGMRYQEVKMLLENLDIWSEYLDKNPMTPNAVQCIKEWSFPASSCFAK